MTFELLAEKGAPPPQPGTQPPSPASRRLLLRAVLGGLCAAVLMLWYVSIGRIDVDAIADTGLVSVLPVTFFIALALLSVSFFVCVRRRAGTGWHAVHVGLLVLVLHGTVPVVYDVPRFAYVYKHLGVVDLVSRYGTVDRTIDAYNNWPGFFLLNALFREASGLPSSVGYAAWAPVFFNLLWVFLLLAAYRCLVGDGAARWMAVWVFLCGSWVGQDYLAPQALGFALYLAIVALALAYLPARAGPALHRRTGRLGDGLSGLAARLPGADRTPQPPARPPARVWDGRARLVVAVLLILFGAVVASHQLSPLLILAAVVVVVVVARRRPWWLPLVMAAMVVAWFGLVAGDFLLANSGLVGDVGQRPDEAISEGLSDLTTAPGQVRVAIVSRVLSGLVWLLGTVGLVLRLRAGHRDWTVVGLALAPLVFIVAVSYGGEMLFRVYLFSLPWVALLAGVALAALSTRSVAGVTAWGRAVVTPLLLLVLACGLVVAGYGLEKVNRIRADEVAASTWFYDNVPDASLMMLMVGNFPSRLEGNYGRFQTNSLLVEEPRYRNHTFTAADVPRLVRILEAYTRFSMEVRDVPEADAYFVLSSSQADYADLYRLATPEQVDSLEAVLASSPLFEVVYSGPDARIYRLQRVVEP
ncbi:hypothetical protein [Georgenia daeguensis]